ncbi:hypothetical protein BDQ17DRAFT_1326473 [Cyathus striatus]|nr:hypothetical protein BDQ17DRAFT_1326473 [Cyathus striatus]
MGVLLYTQYALVAGLLKPTRTSIQPLPVNTYTCDQLTYKDCPDMCITLSFPTLHPYNFQLAIPKRRLRILDSRHWLLSKRLSQPLRRQRVPSSTPQFTDTSNKSSTLSTHTPYPTASQSNNNGLSADSAAAGYAPSGEGMKETGLTAASHILSAQGVRDTMSSQIPENVKNYFPKIHGVVPLYTHTHPFTSPGGEWKGQPVDEKGLQNQNIDNPNSIRATTGHEGTWWSSRRN